MTATELIQIMGLGLDDRFRSMLQVFFERRRSTRYTFVNKKADILVADLDAMGVRDALTVYRKEHRPRPMILFTLDEVDYKTSGDMVVLRKPFTMKQLVSAFDIMDLRFRVGRQRLGALRVKASAEAPVPMPVKHEPEPEAIKADQNKPIEEDPREHYHAAASLSGKGDYVKLNTLLSQALEQNVEEEGGEYDANKYLQGALIKACAEARDKKRNILIEFGSGSITIDVKTEQVQMKMGSFQLRELASFPMNLEKVNINLLPRRQLQIDVDSGRTVTTLDALIWRLAIFASRGRGPQGLDLTEPLGLSAWPNFTRLMLSPGALRIAALWAEHNLSVLQLCKTLKLPQSDVLSLYSAATAIGLIHHGGTEPGAPSSAPRPSGVKGLLGSILKKLHT